MATSSIFHQVKIKDRQLGKALVAALEKSQQNKYKDVQIAKKVQILKGEEIRKLFGDK